MTDEEKKEIKELIATHTKEAVTAAMESMAQNAQQEGDEVNKGNHTEVGADRAPAAGDYEWLKTQFEKTMELNRMFATSMNTGAKEKSGEELLTEMFKEE